MAIHESLAEDQGDPVLKLGAIFRVHAGASLNIEQRQ
jgi:hypothetical protein